MENKTIKDYPNYEISSEGEVYRKERVGYLGNPIKRKRLKPYKGKNGYYMVYLFNGHGQKKSHYIHRLMYQTFIGDIPFKYEIDHIDGNRLNNKAENLRAVSHKSNCNNPKSIENYRKANSLDKGKFNRDMMEACKGKERDEELRQAYIRILNEKGCVGVWCFMQSEHVGYPRAVRICKEMQGKLKNMGVSSN